MLAVFGPVLALNHDGFAKPQEIVEEMKRLLKKEEAAGKENFIEREADWLKPFKDSQEMVA